MAKYLGLFLILTSYMSLFVLGFFDNSRGAVYPEILADLGLNSTLGSMIFVIPSFFSFLASFICKPLVNRYSSFWGLFWGVTLLLLGYFFFTQTRSYVLLAFCLALFGGGLGVIAGFEHAAIQQAVPESQRRRWFSGLHTIYAFASLMAPFLIEMALKSGQTWRDCFNNFSLAGLGVVVTLGLFAVLFAKKGPHPMRINNLHKKNIEKVVKSAMPVSLYSLVLACIFVSFYVCAEISVASRIKQLLTDDFGFDQVGATPFVTYFFTFLFVGRVSFTIFTFEKIKPAKLILFCHVFSFLCFVIGLVWDPRILILCGLTMAPCFALNVDCLAEAFGRASAEVIAQVMGVTALAVVGFHYLLGHLTDLFSVSMAMWVSPVLLVGAMISLWLFEKRTA